MCPNHGVQDAENTTPVINDSTKRAYVVLVTVAIVSGSALQRVVGTSIGKHPMNISDNLHGVL